MQALLAQLVSGVTRTMALRGLVLPVPDGLHNTNMDNIFADSLPLLTMLACVPVLRLFARQQKLTDLVRPAKRTCHDLTTWQSAISDQPYKKSLSFMSRLQAGMDVAKQPACMRQS